MKSFLSTILASALKKLLTDLVDWITAFFDRKKEQKERHKENTTTTGEYQNAKPEDAKDIFDRLP